MCAVNRIEFVDAPDHLGLGVLTRVEPVIDGVSLVDRVREVVGRKPDGFAGLSLRTLVGDVSVDAVPGRSKVLGCGCGDEGCSYVTAGVAVTTEDVRWTDFRTSDLRGGALPIGPFVFERHEYQRSLSSPRHAGAPVRRVAELHNLLACIPADHDEWLDAIAGYGGSRWDASHLAAIAAGCAAFVLDAHPISVEAVTRWAARNGLEAGTSEVLVGLVRAATFQQESQAFLARHADVPRPPFRLPARMPPGARTTLERLERWFAGQADAAAEHSGRLKLRTENGPMWMLEIDLAGTSLADRPFARTGYRHGAHDFVTCHGDRPGHWQAFCGPLNLSDAVRVFLDWADEVPETSASLDVCAR